MMAIIPVRLLGLLLLTLAITIPGCQALFPLDSPSATKPFTPGFLQH